MSDNESAAGRQGGEISLIMSQTDISLQIEIKLAVRTGVQLHSRRMQSAAPCSLPVCVLSFNAQSSGASVVSLCLLNSARRVSAGGILTA